MARKPTGAFAHAERAAKVQISFGRERRGRQETLEGSPERGLQVDGMTAAPVVVGH